jgi:CheY-like chemotaxis protein
MHVRRLLLIDDDPGFQRLLEERLGPYGFHIVLPVDAGNPLGHLKDVRPALIVIAVELPDKVGYALCNKAKKGLARDIPVILTTSSVPASGFRSHRKLKVHADEYIDKRSMTEEEVVAKVDHLVGLSGTASTMAAPAGHDDMEELDMSDLVEEASSGSAELQDDDDGEDGQSAVPRQIAHEGGVEFDPRELGADEDDDGSFDFGEPMHVGASDVARPIGSFSGRPGTERNGSRAASLLSAPAAAATEPDADPRMAGPDLSEMNEFEADRTAVVPPYPSLFDPSRLGTAQHVALAATDDPPDGAPVPLEDEAGIEPSAPVADLDLGLDQVASLAEDERADVSGRHEQMRALELEREVERLRAELEQARQQPAGGSPFSREREFLNLREVINKKEKLVLDLNDELDVKDRQILAEKERLRHLDHVRADLDAKNLELEQSLLGASEELAALRTERKSLSEQLRRQTDSLTSVRGDAEQLSRLLERERVQWREERDGLLRNHAAALDELKQQLESERNEAETVLRDKQSSDLRALKDAYEETSAEKDKGFGAALALAEVRRQEELTAAQRGAEERLQLELAEQRRRHQEEQEGLRREHAVEKGTLLQARADEVETLVRQNREARQALEERHGEQVARIEGEHAQALAAAEERRTGEVAEVEGRRTSELAAAEERRTRELAAAADERARAEADLRERFESARSAMESEHAEVRRVLEGKLADRERELEGRGKELDEALDTLRARADTIESQTALLGERDARIAGLRQEVEELERQNAGYQEQVLRAFQKIKADETTVARAKKAMAIALTLLDDTEQAAAVEQAVRGDD